MAHIILTGATGYIGRSLAAALLERGHNLTLIQRPASNLKNIEEVVDKTVKVILYDGSLESLASPLGDCDADIAIHLATLYRRELVGADLNALIDTNIRFGGHLIEALDQAGVKSFINTGSYWQKHPSHPIGGPINLYAATKAAFEVFVKEAAQNKGFRTITLTLYDVYGKGDDRPKVFNLIKTAARSGTPMMMSPGDQELSFTNIDDVIRGYLIAVDRLPNSQYGSYEAFDLGATPTRLKDAVDLFNGMLDKPAEIHWGATPYAEGQIMAVKTGPTLPGWSPTVSLGKGLETLL